MDFKNFFEYPLPKIKIDVEKIFINMNEVKHGTINIKNIGGGNLSGKIVSSTDYIIFQREDFNGNNISIEYHIVPSLYYSSAFMKSEIMIISNGGEVYIPVFITLQNFDYLKCGKEKIQTIKEFYQYFLKNHIEAIMIFYSYEFIIWLKKINYKHIDIVDELLKNSNKQRAIDNFFVISNVKKKSYIEIEKTNFKYKYFDTKDTEDIVGYIPLKLIGEGYFEEDIILKEDVDFIRLLNKKVTNKDFDKDGYFYVKFKIIKSKLISSFEIQEILFNNMNKNVTIEIIKKSPIEVIFERQYFENIDKGIIKVINNTGKDVALEIISKDDFIKFKCERYLIGEYAEIKFDVKLTGFLKTQMDFTKRPNLESEIFIRAYIEDKVCKIKNNIYVGNSFI